MSKPLITIILTVLGVTVTIVTLIAAIYILRPSPTYIVATTTLPSETAVFLLNGEKQGNQNGFCMNLKDGSAEIALQKGDKKQSVVVHNEFGSKFSVDAPLGENLGLLILDANAEEQLRDEFNCPLEF